VIKMARSLTNERWGTSAESQSGGTACTHRAKCYPSSSPSRITSEYISKTELLIWPCTCHWIPPHWLPRSRHKLRDLEQSPLSAFARSSWYWHLTHPSWSTTPNASPCSSNHQINGGSEKTPPSISSGLATAVKSTTSLIVSFSWRPRICTGI
jgi:hypothetical protein